jgi:hypothetical protein
MTLDDLQKDYLIAAAPLLVLAAMIMVFLGFLAWCRC